MTPDAAPRSPAPASRRRREPSQRRARSAHWQWHAKTSHRSTRNSWFAGKHSSGNIKSWDRRGRVLRASISFVVIGFAASIGTAGAQYLPPEPPPMGYPPPAYYPYRGYPPPAYYGYRGYPPPAYYRANPSAPFQATDQDAGGESYEDEYDRPYPPQRMFGDAPGGMRSEPLAPPAVSPQDRGTAVAALPPDYQPEQGPTKEIPPALPTRPRPRPRLGLPNPSSHEVPKANFWEETAEYYAIELLS